MATKKFLTSVAEVYAYDNNDVLLFAGKTLLDSSIEVSLGSAPVRGGRGNQLQYIYYHTGEMKFTLTDTQWNLAMLGETVGSEYEQGNYYKKENVVVSASSTGVVTETPLAFSGSVIYGWATSPLGVTQRVIFTGKSFTVTGDESDGTWCLRYYTANLSSGQSITISSNMIPKIVKLVMETQLNSSDSTTNKIGIVQVIAPTVALDGAFTLSMKADGVSTTPLTGTALAYNDVTGSVGCDDESYYAKIVEIIDNSNWYDDVTAISISGGDIDIAVGELSTLAVYAVSPVGYSFLVPNAQLTFTSASLSIATVGAQTGIVEGVLAGDAEISVIITSASSVTDSITATVS